MLLTFTPVGAFAKPAEQTMVPQSNGNPAASGVTLQDFQKRGAARLMAGDIDGDGRVSKADFLAAAGGGKGDPEKRFARLDQNSDGFLDKSEVNAVLARRFKRLDADGDGVASAQERTSSRGKHEAARPGVD